MVSLPTEQSSVSFSLDGFCIDLAPGTFAVHKAGMEFDCRHPLRCFSVIQLDVHSACGILQAACPGVVVACEPRTGGLHRVTVLFLDPPQPPPGD